MRRLAAAALVMAAAMVGAWSPVPVQVQEAPAASASMSSPNWSGYAAHRPGTQFTNVRGAWVQPSVSCPNGGTYSSFWIGLDGYASNYVEQVGTGADCTQANQPAHYAWYELYPAARVHIAMVIRAGDHIEAAVDSIAAGTTLTLRNLSTGRTFSTVRRGPTGPLTSAEWIAEAPSACSGSNCNVLPLANFGYVPFSMCSADASGSSGTITSPVWSADVITMVRSNGSVLAQPSPVSGDGASFTVSVH
ncbi:MAG TPA: G1 family glutamic endopeptidase [Candidatus Dormibacteraeota bacterium]|nr:G1 family glutamic endopeptidase [Candidatus Dormibacteraeota bacterium]